MDMNENEIMNDYAGSTVCNIILYYISYCTVGNWDPALLLLPWSDGYDVASLVARFLFCLIYAYHRFLFSHTHKLEGGKKKGGNFLIQLRG